MRQRALSLMRDKSQTLRIQERSDTSNLFVGQENQDTEECKWLREKLGLNKKSAGTTQAELIKFESQKRDLERAVLISRSAATGNKDFVFTTWEDFIKAQCDSKSSSFKRSESSVDI